MKQVLGAVALCRGCPNGTVYVWRTDALMHFIWQGVVLFARVICFSSLMLMVHESGHWMAGKTIGAKCRLRVERMGILLTLSTNAEFLTPLTPRQDLMFTMAGFLSQVVICIPLVVQTEFRSLHALIYMYMPFILINLVPIKPTDGYFAALVVAEEWPRFTPYLNWILWGVFVAGMLAASFVESRSLWLHREAWTQTAVYSAGLVAVGMLSFGVLHNLFARRRNLDMADFTG